MFGAWMDAQPGSHSKAPVNVFATCYHGLQSKHHSGLNYSDSLISHDVVGYVISSSNDRLWEHHCTLYTSPYVPLPTLWMSSKSCWGFLLWISLLGRVKISMVPWPRDAFTFIWTDQRWCWWSDATMVFESVLLRLPVPVVHVLKGGKFFGEKCTKEKQRVLISINNPGRA